MNTSTPDLAAGETLLHETKGLCLECGDTLPMSVVSVPGSPGQPDRVVGRRSCPAHGAHESLLASDARWYYVPPLPGESCGSSCGCHAVKGEGKAALGKNFERAGALPDTLNTCVALIEIVTSCNLACPTCFADSPRAAGKATFVPLEEIQRRVNAAVAKKGDLEILMLSGGEPTLHPQLLELLAWLQAHSGVQYVMLNTNGLKVAADPALARAIGEIFLRPKGGLQVYLQFDGPGEAGQVALRGGDFREVRRKAIANLAAAEVPVTLAMTVTEANLGTLWETVEVALGNEWVHGVAMQPEFSSGRGPQNRDRLTAACVINGLIEQSGDVLTARSITPLPCGNPNCTFVGYVLRRADGTVAPVFDGLPMERLRGFLGDSLHYTLDQLAQCGCDTTEMGALLHGIEGGASKAALGADAARMLAELKAGGRLVRFVVKPFMGRETYDQKRVQMCCTHVLAPDGSIRSFCDYYRN